ncbi:MAG: acyloxyacyl hydrolase [Edaphocola sp.]
MAKQYFTTLKSHFCITCICLSLLNERGTAQNQPWSGFGIEGNVMIGKMIRHSSSFVGTLPTHSYAAEANLFKKTWGQKDWQQRRNYPQVGVTLYYNNYNNQDEYGQVLGIAPNIQLNLVKGQKVEWTVRAGMGVCYDTKPYSRLSPANTNNRAIGGHWNNLSPFSTDVRYHLDNHWDLQAGANFSHVSNAAFEQPNLGINMYGAHAGLRYFPVTANPVKIYSHPEPLRNRWLVQARYSMAFIQSAPADGPYNPIYMGALFAGKRYWSKNKVYGGVDYYYNSATYARLKSVEHFKGEEYSHSTQMAIFAGNEFLVGRLGLMFQAGYYLHKMADQKENYYQKLGGNFYFIQKEKGIVKEAFFSAILKTHMSVAELFEMGIGIGI